MYTENLGQVPEEVRFYQRGGGVWFTDDGLWLDIQDNDDELKAKREGGGDGGTWEAEEDVMNEPLRRRGVVLRQEFVGANPAAPEGSGVGESCSSYFYGRDPSGWVAGAREFMEVWYRDIYDSVDLRYYSMDDELKYDIVVYPGAEIGGIRIRYEGADGLSLDTPERLRVHTACGDLVDGGLYIYQDLPEGRVQVPGSFVLHGDGTYGFEVGEGGYDQGVPLVIDPSLVYSTFMGGAVDDRVRDSFMDPSGDIFITGLTKSVNFPTTPGAYNLSHSGDWDIYVTQLGPDGSSPDYSTFIGGSGDDRGNYIELGPSGDIYVTGYTNSPVDFPVTSGAYDEGYNGGVSDAYVLRLNSSGTQLNYSTYIGGEGFDEGRSLKVSSAGEAWVTGQTNSTGFPTAGTPYDDTHGGGGDIFLCGVEDNGSSLLYSTYIGGSKKDFPLDMVLDPTGEVVIAGSSHSDDFPTTAGAHDKGHNGDRDIVVFRLKPGSGSLEFSTYVGGSETDTATAMELDSSGNYIITGNSSSPNFPTTSGAYDEVHNGGNDAVLINLSSDGSTLQFCTYMGGVYDDRGTDLYLYPSGDVLLVGWTKSSTFPITSGVIDTVHGGDRDAFAAMLTPSMSDLRYSTYLGGGLADSARCVHVDDEGLALVMGETDSTDYPVTSTAYDSTHNGGQDIFMSRFDPHRLWVNSLALHDESVVTGTIYAGKGPYTFRVGATDTKIPDDLQDITISLDPDGENIKVKWNAGTGKFSEVSDPMNLIDIDASSTASVDQSVYWTIDFNLTFDWDYPDELPHDVEVRARSASLPNASFTAVDLYTVENHLNFTGSLIVKGEDGRILENLDAVRGGESLTWEGLVVVYDGTADVYPADDEIYVTVWDEEGNSWHDSPASGGAFILMTVASNSSYEKGHTHKINITGIPYDNDASGKHPDSSFDIIIDGETVGFTDPVPGPGTWQTWSIVDIGINVSDGGGGEVNGSSIEYAISGDSGNKWSQWIPAFRPDAPSINVTAGVGLLDGLENRVRWRADDVVGNGLIESPSHTVIVDTEAVNFTDASPSGTKESPSNQVSVGVRISDATSGVDAETIEYAISIDGGDSWRPWTSAGENRSGPTVDVALQLEFPEGYDNLIRWRASDLAGNGPAESPATNVNVNVKIEPGNLSVVLLLPEDGETVEYDSVQLYWRLSNETLEGATYDVYLEDSYPPTTLVAEGIPDTEFLAEGLTNGARYYWRVVPSYDGTVYGDGNLEVWSFDVNLKMFPEDFGISIELLDDRYLYFGETVSIDIDIANTGPSTDTYILELDPGALGGNVSINGSTEFTLDSVTYTTIHLQVAIPAEGIDKDNYTVSITARSLGAQDHQLDVHANTSVIIHVLGAKESDTNGTGSDDDVTISTSLTHEQLIILVIAISVGLGASATAIVCRVELLFLLAPLMVKVRKKNDVAEWRDKIYGTIVSKPGIHYNMLKNWLDISNGPLIYNLERLIADEMIISKRDGLFRRFYPVQSKLDKVPSRFLTMEEKIAIVVRDNPGAPQSEIAFLLGESKQKIHYNVKKMVQNGVLRLERSENGHTNTYFAKGREANMMKRAIFDRSLNLEEENGARATIQKSLIDENGVPPEYKEPSNSKIKNGNGRTNKDSHEEKY